MALVRILNRGSARGRPARGGAEKHHPASAEGGTIILMTGAALTESMRVRIMIQSSAIEEITAEEEAAETVRAAIDVRGR